MLIYLDERNADRYCSTCAKTYDLLGDSVRKSLLNVSLVIVIGTTTVLLANGSAQAETKKVPEKSAKTTAIMDSLIGSISEVLPLSFDMAEFSSRKNKDKILKDLGNLRENAGLLERHSGSKDKGFAFVAKSLQADAKNLYRWFERGYYDEAKFTLQNMTENCITCHSSLPETGKFPKPEKFLDKISLKSLPPLEKAHYLTISRQFDDALLSYETMFDDPAIHPMNLIALGAFTRYLKLAINVKGDFNRPQKTLEKIAERPQTPVHVRQLVLKWIRELKQYEKSKPLSDISLAASKKILDSGRREMEFPKDRESLIHFVTANAMLNRYVYGHPTSSVETAEAYYMLGVTESLLGNSFWVSRQEFYLETAIRLAPGANFSSKAFTLLEESLIAGYTGSSGTNIPDDVSQLLNELKVLMKNATKE